MNGPSVKTSLTSFLGSILYIHSLCAYIYFFSEYRFTLLSLKYLENSVQ